MTSAKSTALSDMDHIIWSISSGMILEKDFREILLVNLNSKFLHLVPFRIKMNETS